MSGQAGIYFSRVEKALRRLLNAMDEFESLLRDGREQWHEFRGAAAQKMGMTPVSFDDEVERRYNELQNADIEAVKLVKPVSDNLTGNRSVFEQAGFTATNCARWIIARASSFQDIYREATLIDDDGQVRSIESAIENLGLPAPYDRRWIRDTLEEEIQRAAKAASAQRRDDAPLDPVDRMLLETMRRLNVAAEIDPLNAGESIKQRMARLGKLGLVESKRGRGGGCWLTEAGIARIKR